MSATTRNCSVSNSRRDIFGVRAARAPLSFFCFFSLSESTAKERKKERKRCRATALQREPRMGRIASILGLLLILDADARADAPTPQDLARRIDVLLAAQWKDQKVQPAPRADDAEFLRRISLDLTGRIPRVADVRSFLDDKNPNKRR